MDGRVIEGDESMGQGDGNDGNEAQDELEFEEIDVEEAVAARLPQAARPDNQNAHPEGERNARRAQRAARRSQENNAEPSLLDQLMNRIRNLLADEDEHESGISEDQARLVLEASAGDLDVAASLFCDHYYASLAVRRNARPQAENNNEEESPPGRRVRRRLEQQLEEQLAAANNDVEPMDEDQEDDDDAEPEVPADMPPPDRPVAARRVAWNDDANHAEGAAVSDDEGQQRPSFRSRRFRYRQPTGRNIADDNVPLPDVGPLLRNISDPDPPADHALHSRHQVSVKKEHEDDLDEDFLSDDDWIFDEDDASSPARPPESLLWGAPHAPSDPSAGEDGNDPPEGGADNVQNNVIAEDEDSEDASSRAGIPRTWLHSGFTSSTCGSGLVLKPQPGDEIAVFRLRQRQSGGPRNIPPPPYHCRGITALLSVVTGLIYSGASIQGQTVNCKAAREPFAELSESDRKRQFDARLVDALSSLLFIASQASLQRKKRVLAKRESPETGDLEKRHEQSLSRKLRLCPTCRWDDDTGTGDGSLPEGGTVQIATSYSSMEDIRSYVLSTMRSFTKKGGCALFLETIIRIHGKSCVEWMLRRARRKAHLPETNSLIECTCEKQYKKRLQQMSQQGIRSSSQSAFEVLDHSCSTVELLSLLLTGEIRSTFHDWPTGGLGIGILSNTPGVIGRQLMRPEKPVWILRGDTCYSVAWLNGSKEQPVSMIDQPGSVFRLCHWNCWHGDERHMSGMRVITARTEWSPPVFSKERAHSSDKRTVTEAIMASRKRDRSNIVSSDDEAKIEPPITKEEIDCVKIHPDDEKFYPKTFRQWRFNVGKVAPDKSDSNDDHDVKMGPVGADREHWTPYFRLDSRERNIVEMKVSPKINLILWTRWPGATIDKFTPENEEPPVV